MGTQHDGNVHFPIRAVDLDRDTVKTITPVDRRKFAELGRACKSGKVASVLAVPVLQCVPYLRQVQVHR